MWKKGLVENLNQGLWYLTLYLSCCFPTSASGLLGTAPPPKAGPAAPWWQGSLSGPPLCLHPQPQGVTVQPGICAKWLFGPWGTRWTRWPINVASGEAIPGPWDLPSHSALLI